MNYVLVNIRLNEAEESGYLEEDATKLPRSWKTCSADSLSI